MNQRLMHHIDISCNDKYFSFSFVYSAVNFDDLDAALAAFKVEFDKLKALEEERIQKAKDEADVKLAESAPMETEVVS